MWQGKDGEKAYNDGEVLETKYFCFESDLQPNYTGINIDLANQPDYTAVYFDEEVIASKLEYMTKDQLSYLKTVIDEVLSA